ncbi:MAG: two-component hybrid sensor kinase/response regulator [Rhodospirillaceae bacterium]|nr:MAG: two-component hybrid sensor kinase/response regulator [Rhodospirillaceae bacterium]
MAERIAQRQASAGPIEQHLTDGRWIRVSTRRTADHRTVSLHSDITDLKRREQVLLESQALLAEAQRIGHLGWWTLEIGRGRLRWSDEVYRIFGLLADDTTPDLESMMAAIPDSDRLVVQKAIEQASRYRTPFTIEHRINHPGGTYRIVHVKGEVRPDDSHSGQRLLATVLDITERKHIEEELRRSEERYTLAVAGSNEGIWDWDMDNDRVYVSPRFKGLFGLDDDESVEPLTHAVLISRIDPQHTEKYASRLNEHLSGRASYFSCEYMATIKPGEARWFLQRGLALRNGAGHSYRMAGSP